MRGRFFFLYNIWSEVWFGCHCYFFFFTAASRVNFKCYLALAPFFVLSFKMSWYWCHSFSALQSVRQRRGTAMKKSRLRSFSFSFVLFTHKSRRFPQSFFFSFHLSFYFSIFSILSQHQGKVSLRFAIWISNALLV